MHDTMLRLKVLIVDDDAFYADMLESIVSEMGHNVLKITEPSEAIQLVEEHYNVKLQPFDIAFVDFVMPDIDGLSLCGKLTEIDPDLLLVIISEDNSREARDLFTNAGFLTGYVSKCEDAGDINHFINISLATKKSRLSGEKSIYLERLHKKHK